MPSTDHGLRINAASRQRLTAIRAQLRAARADVMSQESLAEQLAISVRTMRNWEASSDVPLNQAIRWAVELQFRFVLIDQLTGIEGVGTSKWDGGLPWEKQELRRLMAPLSRRRREHNIALDDMAEAIGMRISSYERWEKAEQFLWLSALIVLAGHLNYRLELRQLVRQPQIPTSATSLYGVAALRAS